MKTVVRLAVAVLIIATIWVMPTQAEVVADGSLVIERPSASAAPAAPQKVHAKATVNCDGDSRSVECDGSREATSQSEGTRGGPAASASELPPDNHANAAVAAEAQAKAGKDGNANAESSVDASGNTLKGEAKAAGTGQGGTAHTVTNAGRSRKGSTSAHTPSGHARGGCDDCAKREKPSAPPAPAPASAPAVVAPAPAPVAPAPACTRDEASAAWLAKNPDVQVYHEAPFCVKGGLMDKSKQPSSGADTGDSIGQYVNGAYDGYDRIKVGPHKYVSCTVAKVDAATRLSAHQRAIAIEWGHYSKDGNRVCQWQRENPRGLECPHANLVAFDDGCNITFVWRTDEVEECSVDTSRTAIGVPAEGMLDKGFYVATPNSAERVVKPSDCGDGKDPEKCQPAFESRIDPCDQ